MVGFVFVGVGVNRINTGMIIHVGRWQRKIFKRIKKKRGF